MTVKDLLRELHDGLEKGWLKPETRVIMCDDRERGKADPVQCVEQICSGPGEHVEKRISYKKYLKLQKDYEKYLTDLGNNVAKPKYVNESYLKVDDFYCTPRVEFMTGSFEFRDGTVAKDCMLILNDASNW